MARTEPPYYELIQADGDTGIFSTENVGQIMYYGLWESDIPGRIQRLGEQGVGIDAIMGFSADVPPYALITAKDRGFPDGARRAEIRRAWCPAKCGMWRLDRLPSGPVRGIVKCERGWSGSPLKEGRHE